MVLRGDASSHPKNDTVSVFHGDQSLAYNQEQPESWWSRTPRQVRAALKVLIGRGDAVVIADAAAALKPNDGLRKFLTNAMVNKLYSALLHPPLSYKGPQFQHRAADGGNNVLFTLAASWHCSS